ncbi:MAG: pitrilysin family protein [Gemmatimonadaceae bacterium]|nr:pitrilysin family protein [Gemmatimonadaceae bacterium]
MTSFIDPSTVHHVVLANGLTVLVRRDTSAPVVAIVTHVKAGYFDETDEVNGIAHVLEHMFFKGTERRGVGDIAKETKASGGYLNAHTIYDGTVYHTVLPSSSFAAGLDIQADAYANSIIDASELTRELEVIIQEAKRKADNPPALAVETLYELLHDEHRMRRWRIGHEAGLRALDRDAMTRFYRNFYQPSNTILSIVGDVDVDEVMRRVEELYAPLSDGCAERNPGPAEPHHDDFRYRELNGDISQSQVVLGWRTPNAMHEDTPVLDVAAHILAAGRASRLYRALRERQLASSVSAYNYTPTELGVFVVQAETRPERAVEAARAAWDQVRALREDPIRPAELERVRRIFEARWMRRFESMEGQANYLAEWEAFGDWKLGDDYYARFMSVTIEQIHDVVSRHLSPERAGVVIYRPAVSPSVASDASGILSLLDAARPEPLDPLPRRETLYVPGDASAPRLESVEAGVSVFRTANGMPILVRPKPGAAIVHIGLHAVGGVRDEPRERAGMTTLAMRTTIKGTTSRTAAQIAEDSEMLGGSIGTSVGSESFGWSMSVPVQHLEAAVGLLADVVENAVIPEDALETERTVTLSDLAALRDDMFRFPIRLLMLGAYQGHPYSLSPLGTEESLRELSVEDVRQWYRGRLLSSPLVIGIVGDVIPADAAAVVARELDSLRPGEPRTLEAPSWPADGKVVVESREKAQTALALAFPGPPRDDDRRFAAQLTATIASGLGGRFFDELRDRQSLAYTVHAYTSEHQLAGMFLAYIATSPEKEEVARQGLLAEFAKLCETRVSDEELGRAQRYAIGSHAIRQESGAAVLGDLLDAWTLGSGLRELTEHDGRVLAVTSAGIQELAQTFFDPARRVEGVVRGVGKIV